MALRRIETIASTSLAASSSSSLSIRLLSLFRYFARCFIIICSFGQRSDVNDNLVGYIYVIIHKEVATASQFC